MGQHLRHTTGETWNFPTRPPSHQPFSNGEISGYNTLCGMLAKQSDIIFL